MAPLLGLAAAAIDAQDVAQQGAVAPAHSVPPTVSPDHTTAQADADVPPDTATGDTQPSGSNGHPAGTGDTTAKPSTECFRYTMHCPPDTTINLTPPDIRTVVSPQELSEPLPTPEQQQDADDSDTVQVRAPPTAPDVPGGFGALWWALRHPTQAWRIFAPVE